MKFWRYSLVTIFAFFGIASTVLFTSCEQDSCLELKCRNGGTCAEGYCRCIDGYEGTECEIPVYYKFLGFYDGVFQYDGLPSFRDSAMVSIGDTVRPDILAFSIYSQQNDVTIIPIVKGVGIIDEPGRYIRITKSGSDQIEIYREITTSDSTVKSRFQGTLRTGTKAPL